MIVPAIHLNGTSKDALTDQLSEAGSAVQSAIAAVNAAAPNGRDYYPQGPQAIGQAIKEHNARITRLTDLYDELVALYEAIEGGGHRI